MNDSPKGVPLPMHRRFRPATFADVVGQATVVESLKGALKVGQTSGAYLFSGPHGTGKTTLGRIYAAAVNCSGSDRDGLEPCGKCPSCEEILSGSEDALDYREFDAGFETGVDAARDLAMWANQTAMRDRKRIVLIDEVQQRSRGADSVWLKLLEECPEHLLVLMATTEPEKVLPTVRSRSICLQLRPHTEQDVAERLRHIADLEEIRASDAVLVEIAAGAQGHMRDALQTFQRMALMGREITLEDVWEGTSRVPPRLAGRLVMSLLNNDGVSSLQQAIALLQSGIPAEPLMLGMAGTFRDLAVLSSMKGAEALVRLPSDLLPMFQKVAALRSTADWRMLLHETEVSLRRLKFHSGRESLLVDLYVLELLHKLHSAPAAAPLAPPAKSPATTATPAAKKPAVAPPPARDKQQAPPATVPSRDDALEALIGAVRNTGQRQALRRANNIRISDDSVSITPANNRHRSLLSGVKDELAQLFSELLGRDVDVEVAE